MEPKAFEPGATDARPLSFAEQMSRVVRLRVALAELGEMHRAAWDTHLRKIAESFVGCGGRTQSGR